MVMHALPLTPLRHQTSRVGPDKEWASSLIRLRKTSLRNQIGAGRRRASPLLPAVTFPGRMASPRPKAAERRAAQSRPARPGPEPAPERRVVLPPDWLPLALLAGDTVVVVASVLGAYWYYRNLDPIRQAEGVLPIGPYLLALPVAALIFVAALALNRQSSSWRGRALVDLLFGLYSGIGLAALLLLAAISLTNLGKDYSRLTILYTVFLAAVLMTAERYLLRQYETRLRRRGIGAERVLMVGTGPASEILLRRMSMFPQYGFQVCGVLDDRLRPGSDFAGAEVVGAIDELPARARELGADQVFIAADDQDRGRLLHLVKLCEDLRLEFKVIPDLLAVMSTRAEVNSIDGLPVLGIRRNRLTGTNAVVKRVLDVIVSALALLLLALPLGVVALLIKLTSP